MLAWLSVYGARCKQFAHGPADATANPSSLPLLKFQTSFTFLGQAYPGSPAKHFREKGTSLFKSAYLSVLPELINKLQTNFNPPLAFLDNVRKQFK